MKYIITGGKGFIGSNLCNFLKDNNVVCLDNLHSKNDNILHENIKFFQEDIRNPNIEKYFEEGDIVVHLAAISPLPECQSNPVEAYDVNINGTLNILEICRKKNIKKIIFASTSAVYENNKKFPCTEEDTVNPTLIYSMTKYHGENICKSYIKNYNMNICIIRFFNTYGNNQNYKRTSPPLTIYIMNELKNNKIPILHSDGEQKRDYIYIDDLIDLIMKTIEKDTNNMIFNACSGNLITVNQIFNIIKKFFNSSICPKYHKSDTFWNKYPNLIEGNNVLDKKIIINEVNKYSCGSNKKAINILNWKPNIDMEEGLKIIYTSFK